MVPEPFSTAGLCVMSPMEKRNLPASSDESRYLNFGDGHASLSDETSSDGRSPIRPAQPCNSTEPLRRVLPTPTRTFVLPTLASKTNVWVGVLCGNAPLSARRASVTDRRTRLAYLRYKRSETLTAGMNHCAQDSTVHAVWCSLVCFVISR